MLFRFVVAGSHCQGVTTALEIIPFNQLVLGREAAVPFLCGYKLASDPKCQRQRKCANPLNSFLLRSHVLFQFATFASVNTLLASLIELGGGGGGGFKLAP